MFTSIFLGGVWLTTKLSWIMEQESEVPIWSMSTEELFHRNFPVHQACRNGDLESLSALLSSGNVDFYEEDSFTGWSPLHWAANFGKVIFIFKMPFINCFYFVSVKNKWARSTRLYYLWLINSRLLWLLPVLLWFVVRGVSD